MESTPAERRLAAQYAAHKSWAQTESRSLRTLPARMGLQAKFEREADPDSRLAPAERARRAEHLRKAYYANMALKSAQARRRRAGGGK
jgi:hypothetical protein